MKINENEIKFKKNGSFNYFGCEIVAVRRD